MGSSFIKGAAFGAVTGAVANELTGPNSAVRGMADTGMLAANSMVNTALFGFSRSNSFAPHCGFGCQPAMDLAWQLPSFQNSPLGMPMGAPMGMPMGMQGGMPMGQPFGGGMLPPPSQVVGDAMQQIQQHLASGMPLPPALQQLLMSGDPALGQVANRGHSPVTHTVDSSVGSMDFDRAVRTLANDFEKVKDGGGTISLDRLKTIANAPPGSGFSPELQAAARHLVDNPDDFKKLETADQKKGGKRRDTDGKVGLTDLTAILPTLKGGVGDKQLWDDLMSNAKGLFNGRDAFHFDDIRKIAEQGVYPDGSRATPQQQASAAALFQRKDLLMAADSADKDGVWKAGQLGDQKISQKDVENMQKQATAGAKRKDLEPTILEKLTFGILR